MSSNENPETPVSACQVESAPASNVAPANAPAGGGMQRNATICNTSGGGQLTGKQVQAIELLLQGQTDAAVAGAVGVNRWIGAGGLCGRGRAIGYGGCSTGRWTSLKPT